MVSCKCCIVKFLRASDIKLHVEHMYYLATDRTRLCSVCELDRDGEYMNE